MRFTCPSCNQALLAQQQAAETQGKCPFCGAKFTVPALGSPLPPGAVADSSAPKAAGGKGGREWGSADSRELWLGFSIGLGIAFGFLFLMFPFKGIRLGQISRLELKRLSNTEDFD